MRLVFLGPPGGGKGTQAKLSSQRLGLRHLSTGDILREAILQNTPEGRLVEPYVSSGRLVPDEVVNEIVRRRFRAPDRPERFIMDGYPRNLPQARDFDRVLHKQGLDLNAVVYLNVADEDIVKRLSGRWNCPNPSCGASYNLQSNPPRRPGICDVCGTVLVQREDDRPETVLKRLEVFHSLFDSLVDYYRKRGLLLEVPGVGDIDAIYGNIVQALRAEGIE